MCDRYIYVACSPLEFSSFREILRDGEAGETEGRTRRAGFLLLSFSPSTTSTPLEMSFTVLSIGIVLLATAAVVGGFPVIKKAGDEQEERAKVRAHIPFLPSPLS